MIRTVDGRAVGAGRVGAAALLVAALTTIASSQETSLAAVRNRGQALFEEARYGEAAEAFERVVARPEASANDWVNLALARYEAAGGPERDGAIHEALDRALAAQPELGSAWYLRGLAHARRSETEAALEAFRRAAALAPTDPGARYNLGATLEALGDGEAARREYERVMGMGFDVGLQHHVSATYRTAFMLLRAGDREGAQPLFAGYQANQRRLSQAQRAPAALEASLLKRVVVPRRNAVAADPESGRTLRFARVVLGSIDAGATPVAFESGESLQILAPGSPSTLLGAEAGSRRLAALPAGVVATGDADQDRRPDLAIAGEELAVWANVAGVEDPWAASPIATLAGVPGASALDWVDTDHDGDLDLLVVAGGLRLHANQGGGRFVEVTEAAGFGSWQARAVIWADFDDDNDVDLYAYGGANGNGLFSNARGGRFEEVGAAVGARATADTRAAAAADFDNDGALDLLIAGPGGVELLRNHGNGTFAASRRVADFEVSQIGAGDFNNDGWLDVVAAADTGLRLLINAADGFVAGPELPVSAGARLVGVYDVDRDGALDLIASTGTEVVAYRQPGPVARWLRVELDGIKNNRLGVGAFVEVKAGELYQRRLVQGESLHFGLADLDRADVVRITWPNGIVQNELDVAADARLGPVTEVERLEGSCPLLYTWDGTSWRFVNEVLGVAPLGMPLGGGAIHPADFDEYVPVPRSALRADGGQLRIRLTEELRETGYIDAIRLLAIDHPAGTTVVPDERFVAPPHPEFRLFLVDERRAVVARDHEGRDWSEALARVDRSWARPFEPVLYEGLATPHAIELTLPEVAPGDTVRLFLTGWVYWATGSINLQVDEDPRVGFEPVSLSVPDGQGGWRQAIADIGLPNAKNSTLSVDLTGIVDPADPRVRIATTMRLYWDEAYYTAARDASSVLAPVGDWAGDWQVPRAGVMPLRDGSGRPSGQVRAHVLAPGSATIGWRGFSALERTADGFETFDYARVSQSSNWDQHRGSYTRYGEVGGLLTAADDRFVIVGTGDEVEVIFRDTLPPVAAGSVRDWLVYLNGWVKDGDPNTLHGDRVEPLPFHAMSEYPYSLAEAFPDDPAHRAWRQRYNTRPARRVNEPLGPRR